MLKVHRLTELVSLASPLGHPDTPHITRHRKASFINRRFLCIFICIQMYVNTLCTAIVLYIYKWMLLWPDEYIWHGPKVVRVYASLFNTKERHQRYKREVDPWREPQCYEKFTAETPFDKRKMTPCVYKCNRPPRIYQSVLTAIATDDQSIYSEVS